MAYDAAVRIPVILFGAFDRHNFGDLLLPHVVAALMPGQQLVFAGLADRDLRRHGGHEVTALSRLGLGSVDHPCVLIHVGGELLTCDPWHAAVMLLPSDQAQRAIAYLETRPREKLAWVRGMLGTSALAPYTVSRQAYPGLVRVIYNGVGGTGLDQADPDLRAEVLANLRAAAAVSVRDEPTLDHLAGAGIRARLIPDPAVLVAELFGAGIRRRARDLRHTAERLASAYRQGVRGDLHRAAMSARASANFRRTGARFSCGPGVNAKEPEQAECVLGREGRPISGRVDPAHI